MSGAAGERVTGRRVKLLPPGEWAWAARAYPADRAKATYQVMTRHGHLVRLPHWRRIYVATHPEDIERVLITNAANYRKSFDYRILADVLGGGLLTSEGDAWRRDRRMSQPFFHQKAMAQFFSSLTRAAERAIDRLAAAGPMVAFSDQMQKLSLDIIGSRIFSDEAEQDAAAVSDSIAAANEYLARRAISLVDWRKAIWTPARRAFDRHLARLDALLSRRIAQRKADPVERADLLSMFLAARDDDDQLMSDTWVRDQVVTTFVTGQETTAAGLCWLAVIFAQRPDVLGRVRDEVPVAGISTYDDLKRLPYLRAVVEETLRMYPPIPAFGRESLAADTLGDSLIARGSTIAFCSYATHRNPELFPDPETFDPERFLGERKKSLPRGAYIPFGAGQRICIGAVFAEAEMMLFGALLARRFSELTLKSEIEPQAHISYRPKGPLWMELRERAR